ncbi:hypothetical protein N2601_19440 [Rhizobium sp. CB3060]|uniref:hypothetical protein n=1 Tax=Rhizobium sp. CB3060 TaxID=3138255 RepID=UPI0021A400E2|nr:hypothetical protein [Rhizobium tropici]UWU21376.1 hypothetical protein N2601_19440 [Rhizobium tropici]
MDILFKSSSNFASLSLKDLVEARDLFHYHLMNKKNVVATALGLYRIRKSDPWPSKHEDATRKRSPESERRTLFNSEVRPYSWPCIYVFVSNWEYEKDLAKTNPSDVVPKTLYLPDGRTVPVCVIEARKQQLSKDLKIKLDGRTPRNLLAPGSAIINEDGQGMTRLATAGCVVRDSERYFVMTNRHVVGEPGTEISALQTHRRPKIGVSAKKGLGRQDFRTIYPNFASTNQRLLMDVGLVELDNILQWKTEFPGIAPIGPVLDLYDNSFSLKLITMKVIGQSAVTGTIRGEIHGLFYRYKAMGGSEYISDFLIGPETYGIDKERLKTEEDAEARNPAENISLGVHHGDSGTALFIEHVEKTDSEDTKAVKKISYYPFALLWGKEEFFEDGESLSQPYALATSLSTALDHLDLDFVRDINLDQDFIWGWVGHYIIGRSLPLSADLVTSQKLQGFLDNNLDLLALTPDAALGNDPRVLEKDDDEVHFVPLADVPDNVWKSNVNFIMVEGPDGKKQRKVGPGSRGQNDNPNHFADLDLPYENGETFLALNQSAPDTYLNPKAWIDYFAEIEPQYDAWAQLLDPNADLRNKHWGALPFRVHQLFDIMVKAARDGDAAMFLCAGGVLIHYMGDACQPLHTSYLSQGDPAKVVPRPRSSKMKLEADGVHVGYEDDMIAYGYQQKNLGAELAQRITDLAAEPMPPITDGYEASKAVIALISATQRDIAPRDIVDKWVELIGKPAKEKAAAMWDDFGDRTITCMARGTRYLAKIWQAAWEQGNGDANIQAAAAITEAAIMALYNDPDKMPSVALDRYPDDRNSDWSKITRKVQA